jgi:outer membrane biosynthesis protein TonB
MSRANIVAHAAERNRRTAPARGFLQEFALHAANDRHRLRSAPPMPKLCRGMARRPYKAMPLGAFALTLGAALFAAPLAFAAGKGGAGGDVLAPKNLLTGPSLLETGKISPTKLEGDPPPKAVPPAPKLPARPEPKVAASQAPHVAPAPPPPAKVKPSPALEQQITARLHELNGCRVEVARDKHVPAPQIRAGAVVLRWTIGRDGTVSGVEVVEKTPVDPAVLECTQQAITKWTFPLPDNGPLPIERHYRFHAGK